jgi:polysaccharide pyruvyl transferase WcaK-like protein
VIHHVFANRSNVGDWLSARGIQSLLAPLPITEHLCDAPFVPETLAALATATERDFIVIGGGGLFMDYFVPFWQGFRPIAARVPFVIWGVGCCDVKREQTLPPWPLIEEIVRRARLCVVRDEYTRRWLGSCPLPPPVPCPTVAVVPAATAPPSPRLLHVDSYDNVGPEIFDQMVRLSEDFARRTGRSYCQTNNLIPAGNLGALQQTLALYAAADLVLTSRLHGCIIALATGRRVLAVSGDHKMESFMEGAGLGDWLCDLDEVDALPTRLERLAHQAVPTDFIAQARTRNRAVAAQVRALILAGQAAAEQQ